MSNQKPPMMEIEQGFLDPTLTVVCFCGWKSEPIATTMDLALQADSVREHLAAAHGANDGAA